MAYRDLQPYTRNLTRTAASCLESTVRGFAELLDSSLDLSQWTSWLGGYRVWELTVMGFRAMR